MGRMISYTVHSIYNSNKITCSGPGKQLRVCEAQLWGVKLMMVWSMSLHQVPWIESEPVKKSNTNK